MHICFIIHIKKSCPFGCNNVLQLKNANKTKEAAKDNFAASKYKVAP